MTNQELYKEIKRVDEKLDKMQETQVQMCKEFYLFKGKAFGFITVLTGVFTIIFDYLIKKI